MNNFFKKLICFFLGHSWMIINSYKKRRRCGRCGKKQVWTIKFNRLDVYNGWL